MNHLKELTNKYVEAFDSKNIDAVQALIHEFCNLKDPNNVVKGKDDVVAVILELFQKFDSISFKGAEVFQEENTTILEFILILNDNKMIGTDIIVWQDGLIKELRAYLYEEK